MAYSMISNFSNLSSLSTPVETDPPLPLSYHDMLYNYLGLLGFDFKNVAAKHHLNYTCDTFKTPNAKAFQLVAHFLLTKLDKAKASEEFRDVWPILDKKQEAAFRRKVHHWLSQIQGSNKDGFFPHILNPAVLMQPGGDKFAELVCWLASHVLQKDQHCPREFIPPTLNQKPGITQHFQMNILKLNLDRAQQEFLELKSRFARDYLEMKRLGSSLVEVYRSLEKRKQDAGRNLAAVVERSSLTDSEKQSLFDNNNNGTCKELTADIKSKEEHLDGMVYKILSFGKVFAESSDTIHSVLGLKKGRFTINGKEIINHLSADHIERYQKIHSGTQLELKTKNGCYDFLPLLNLMLSTVPAVVGVSKRLSFPPFDDELVALRKHQESIRHSAKTTAALNARWAKIFNEQTVSIEKLLLAKMTGTEAPMTLQPFTPLRNMLSNGDKRSNESNMTPAIMRTALSTTTLYDNGKVRSSVNGSRRPSLEPQSHRDDYRRASIGRCAIENRRRSHEAVLELCRKKSLTPDSLFRPNSSGRTPMGASNLNRGRPGTSSLAASPILERVMMMSEGAVPSTPIQMKTGQKPQQRRSLPHQDGIPLRKVNNRGAVLDHAADAIAYDLVNIDSPDASFATGIIDPNCSIERAAFASKNMLARSPQQNAQQNGGIGSTSEYLKVLEDIFVPSLKRSSLPAAPRNSSPLPAPWMSLEFEQEKGLLDASSASLIDDVLDFSLGL